MTDDFEAPGHGQWAIDRSHYPNGCSLISQWLLTEGVHRGMEKVFAELGLAAERVDMAFVNGFCYTRLRPLIGGDSAPRKPPPTLILKLVTRLHPEFRKRNRAAIAALQDRPSNAVVQRWEDELKPALVAANRRLQAADVAEIDDAALQAHIIELLDGLKESFELHFWLHGHDLGPIARYLYNCIQWDIDPADAVAALAGASPSTSLPAKTLCELRRLLEAATPPPTTLTELRDHSAEARALIDRYLDERGNILATGYDIDSRRLVEMPEAIFKSIQTATMPPEPNAESITNNLRSQVSPTDQSDFDERLADARAVMDMRDDNGPLTIEWPVGLLRRALLEAGKRLAERNRFSHPDLVLELDHNEARSLFSDKLPSSSTLETRRDARAQMSRLDPPATLGPDEPEPPLDALQPALSELIVMTQTALKYLGMDGTNEQDKLSGTGIGNSSYVGTARVASSADQAIDELEPGDVLIVRATSPAFNVVLAIAGAVVTTDGGAMSHAAVLARELGIPAVIGASGALDIESGTTVEVDANTGTVRRIG